MTSFLDAIQNAQYYKKRKEMKVIIWVHKNDIIANKILTYHFTRPMIDRHDDYVQVLISVDEFAKLEDRESATLTGALSPTGISERVSDKDINEKWMINQYNRNKDPKDWVTSIDQIKK